MTDQNSSVGGVQGELHQDRFVGTQDLTRWDTRAGQLLASAVRRASTLVGPHGALILTLLVGAVLAASLTALFAQVYEAVVETDGVAGLDHPVLDFAKSIRSPAADTLVTAYTDIGGTVGMPILAVTALVILTIRRRSWTPGILIVIAGAGSLLMTIAGKQLIGRTRPPLTDAVPPYEHSASFPSGHSLNAVVIAGIVAYLIILRLRSRRARIAAIIVAALFALTIGLSRVFLGHHWLTDVLAAWTLGAAWLTIMITAHRLYLTARKHHSTLVGAGHQP
ncbi:phosphatase PAP2 family protein [Arthrobacter sedimenti]|uniref:Phosphatase PAP2 family protein n=1 Tax=Arthrobacter sedimenti TaxID=2694931 RepID=A0ABV8WJR9_9MICC